MVGYIFSYRALDEAEILNLAVHPEHRRLGIGRGLLDRVLGELARGGVHRVHLEVRETNLAAQAFYREMGFQPAGRRRGYYSRPREDALILTAEIPPNRPE